MNDRWRFGLAFGALMISAASASHFWALDDGTRTLISLALGVVAVAVLLRRRRSADLKER